MVAGDMYMFALKSQHLPVKSTFCSCEILSFAADTSPKKFGTTSSKKGTTNAVLARGSWPKEASTWAAQDLFQDSG
jgi:hypothetical protein